MLGKLVYPTIKDMIDKREYFLLKDALSEMPPTDIAELLEDIDDTEDCALLFRIMPHELATECFENLSPNMQEQILKDLSREKIRLLLEDMSPDDRTELLEELPPTVTRKLLSIMSMEERRLASTLLAYPEDSVGRLMTPDFIYIYEDLTVEDALQKIRKVGIESETIYSSYVIDRNKVLQGVISLKELVLADPQSLVIDLMNRTVISVKTHDDKEEAAMLCERYDVLALPVVNRDGVILGIVTVDDLMEVIIEEATEDIQMIGAVIPSEEGYMNTSVRAWIWRRSVWLIILLFAGLLTALILKKFGTTLEQVIALTFFIPTLTSTGGNTGSQASVLVVRALALGEVRFADIFKILRKEILIGLLLSSILGALLFLIVMAVGIEGGTRFALAISLGLGSVVFISNLVGTVMPVLLKILGLDPALMSGPFIATIIDVVGLIIYLQIAVFMLGS